LLLSWSSFTYGQIDSCLERLSQASQLYEKGKLAQVIQTLENCLYDRSQNRVTRRTALNLAAEAYIFMDSTRLAKQALLELLKIDPFYKVNSEIPEMVYLREQVINFPAVEISGFFGPNFFTRPNLQSAETVPGAVITSRNYGFKRSASEFDIDWGYQAGADLGLALSRFSNFDLHFGINVSRYYFRYSIELDNVNNYAGKLDKAGLFVAEKHLWLRMPIYLSFNLIPREEIVNRRLVPYFKLGASYDRLHRASAKISKLELKFQSVSVPFVSPAQDVGPYRQASAISAITGAGIKLHLHRLFLLMDAQYSHTFQNLRKTQQERLVIEEYRYVDNDFNLSNLNIRLGFGLFLFNAKVKQ
jgi:hypothetical protein